MTRSRRSRGRAFWSCSSMSGVEPLQSSKSHRRCPGKSPACRGLLETCCEAYSHASSTSGSLPRSTKWSCRHDIALLLPRREKRCGLEPVAAINFATRERFVWRVSVVNVERRNRNVCSVHLFYRCRHGRPSPEVGLTKGHRHKALEALTDGLCGWHRRPTIRPQHQTVRHAAWDELGKLFYPPIEIMGKEMPANRGFSLIELMVTIAVMGIIAGIAFPSLRDLIINSRVSTQTNEFIAALNYARSEAIKRGLDVMVCARDGTNLGNGWFIMPGTACSFDPDPCDPDSRDPLVLVCREALKEVAITPGRASLQLSGRGGLVGGAAILTLSAEECPTGSERKREISILGSGRIAVERKTCS